MRGDLSSKAIHREIDGMLRRLVTDYLDLYIIHRFDYETPIEETMEAPNDLVKAGKVPALGASAMYAASFRTCRRSPRTMAGTTSAPWRTTTTCSTGRTRKT